MLLVLLVVLLLSRFELLRFERLPLVVLVPDVVPWVEPEVIVPLLFMLLFFGLLAAALTARPGTKPIGTGALVMELRGSIVEQPTSISTARRRSLPRRGLLMGGRGRRARTSTIAVVAHRDSRPW